MSHFPIKKYLKYDENLSYSIVLTVVFCLTIIQLYVRDAEIEKMIAEFNAARNS